MKFCKKNVVKLLVACIAVMLISMFYVGDEAHAGGFNKKKNESCYLSYSIIEVGGEAKTLNGSIKPIGVPTSKSWNEYFKQIKLKTCKIVKGETCGNNHDKISMHIYVDGEWKEIITFQKAENGYIVNESVDSFTLNDEFYDVKIGISGKNGLYASTCMYARFAREYSVFYDMAGGKFNGKTVVNTYTAGADYKIENPVRDGYTFVGWTGTGLKSVTKNLVIENGTKGNVKFTANWTKTGATNTPAKKDETTTTTTTTKKPVVKAPGKAKVSSASKKLSSKSAKISIKKISGAAGYKIQFSTAKKFKKVLWEKTVTKNSISVSNKKLKNKKTLYVRVKAYKLDGKKKVWASKWSSVKKVTVTKR